MKMNLTSNTTGTGANVTAPIPMEDGAAAYSVNVDRAIEDWKAYQKITSMILDETDYVTIKGNQYKKKSAWRKYSRAFNISTQIIEKEILKNDKGIVTEANFVVRATLPSGRYADGWGNCSRREGNKAHPSHDIPATAHTRASNRAIADLIGAGEVSAEEIQAEVKAAARENAMQKFKNQNQQKPKEDVEFIDVAAETVDADDDPAPVNTMDTAREIAASIVAELPTKTIGAAYSELARLNKLGILNAEDCAAVKSELDKMLK